VGITVLTANDLFQCYECLFYIKGKCVINESEKTPKCESNRMFLSKELFEGGIFRDVHYGIFIYSNDICYSCEHFDKDRNYCNACDEVISSPQTCPFYTERFCCARCKYSVNFEIFSMEADVVMFRCYCYKAKNPLPYQISNMFRCSQYDT